MGLPYKSHHGGQILFGPKDGYLYFMMGDGGSKGDPHNFAQNKKSLLGKIMRFDVNDVQDAKATNEFQLWGNYSIPKDNPFSQDKNLLLEIWAMGVRNPWRCSFDAERPSYFMCGDVGEDKYEEVDMITKGGNYGWSYYEGTLPFNSSSSTKTNNSTKIANPIFPVMGYNHSDINQKEGSASITGGYFYRSSTDPCLYGMYLFADLYAGVILGGAETPVGSGNFTTSPIPIQCASDSPISCSSETEPSSSSSSTSPPLGFVFSFGQDNNKDVYLLASTGLYRIVRPSRCSFSCSLENKTSLAPSKQPNRSPLSPSSSKQLDNIGTLVKRFLVWCFFLVVI